jgi:hypothetical protein
MGGAPRPACQAVSGVAAVWRLDGAPLPPADLDRVLERLTPRPDDPDGMRVFLEGTGGDIVVSHGTGYLGDLARQGRWFELGREARRLSQAFERPIWRVLRTAGGVSDSPSRLATRAPRRLPRAAADPGGVRAADPPRRAPSRRGAGAPALRCRGGARRALAPADLTPASGDPGDARRRGPQTMPEVRQVWRLALLTLRLRRAGS